MLKFKQALKKHINMYGTMPVIVSLECVHISVDKSKHLIMSQVYELFFFFDSLGYDRMSFLAH